MFLLSSLIRVSVMCVTDKSKQQVLGSARICHESLKMGFKYSQFIVSSVHFKHF